MAISIELYEKQIIDEVTNDNFGRHIALEWSRLIRPYVPYATGQLQQNVTIKPFEITYDQPYAHYMYEGILYVDPVTGSSYAEFGTEKVPTNKKLSYRKDHNPFATDHWDQKAARAGQLEKLYKTINNALKRGIY